jgi:hypothetical protein
VSQTRRVAGSAALVLVEGAALLRPEPALFEAMLEGWLVSRPAGSSVCR